MIQVIFFTTPPTFLLAISFAGWLKNSAIYLHFFPWVNNLSEGPSFHEHILVKFIFFLKKMQIMEDHIFGLLKPSLVSRWKSFLVNYPTVFTSGFVKALS